MSGPNSAKSFSWFTTWVNQRVTACLTFGRGLSWQQMLEGFGIEPPTSLPAETSLDASVSGLRVQVGSNTEWGWAIEQFTVRGTDPETLGRLSSRGSEALSLAFTQKMSSFLFAADGGLVSGFDLTVPHIRFGPDPHRFDAAMAQAGLVNPAVLDPPATGALFLKIAFGLTLTPDMLRAATRSAELR